jgi:hypothetical protein
MSTPDMINGAFELAGALLICMSIRRLHLDGQVKGVSVIPITFFALWGLWNLFFYPHLGQWWSFWGGVAMVVTNTIWLLQMVYVIWVAPPLTVAVTRGVGYLGVYRSRELGK